MSNTQQRKIIHIDADAFYASVEIRENPSLEGKPIAVGGSPNSRGVIATCNYAARQFGVRSAMPSSVAKRHCPELIFIKPKFNLYREVSGQIRKIMERYTSIIEPLSLDEAYLDVSDSEHCQGSATLIAEAIRRAVKQELSITVSAGVAPNKFLAKIASDWQKPDGLFVIQPEDVDDFVKQLPVDKINGVGKVTTQKLNDMSVFTCGDLQSVEQMVLDQRFGKYGKRLFNYARGIDHREVQVERQRKSLSIEHTYGNDLYEESEIQGKAAQLFQDLLLRKDKLPEDTHINKRFVKVKFANFVQTTMEEIIQDSDEIWREDAFLKLIRKARERSDQAIRLMGMGVRIKHATPSGAYQQLSLF